MINAVILLNDDLDNMDDCNLKSNCKNFHFTKSQSNLFFLLSVSIPRPLFPSKFSLVILTLSVAGKPIIYHHIRSLSEVEQVQHIFLIGDYDSKKFSYFIDEMLS